MGQQQRQQLMNIYITLLLDENNLRREFIVYIYVNLYVETSLDEVILYIFLCEMPELGTTYLTIMK